MKTERRIFAGIAEARALIRGLYPDAKRVRFVEHSYDNLVALVDETYAVRFPRDEPAYARSRYEREILERLAHLALPYGIPKLLGEHKHPPYMIVSFLPGRHLDPQEIGKFSLDSQKELGKHVATFAYMLQNALSAHEVAGLRKKYGLDALHDEPWAAYFATQLQRRFPTQMQDDIAKQYYQSWKTLDSPNQAVVIHDDLHTENMLFEHGRLTGILDFGDTNIGTPEEEFRQLYHINETVLHSAVDTYNRLSGLRLDAQTIKLWAVMQELAAYSRCTAAQDTASDAFQRARRNLNAWLPEAQWGAHAAP